MPLTDVAIRKTKPGDKLRKLSDSGGLQLHIFPNGSRLWRYAYRFDGKARTMAFGAYPGVTLQAARRLHFEAREKVLGGVDPQAAKRREQAVARAERSNTFGLMADALIEKKEREARADRTMEKVRWLLSLARPALGERPLNEITAGDILAVLRPIERAGKLETARRLRSLVGEVFRLAIANDLLSTDPTLSLRGALVTPRVRHHAAITDPAKLGELMRAIDGFTGQPQTKAALQLLSLTALRPGELRLSKWTDIDFEGASWSVEAGRMKQRRAHRVPLPGQAVTILSELRRITGHGRDNLIFPSARSVTIPISENTMNAALRRLGFSKEEMTSHGFRASFSSLANESGLWNRDAVERQLSHVDQDAVRRAYARSDFFEERQRMMQWWADELERFRTLPSTRSAQ